MKGVSNMLERLKKLLTVKSILTLFLTALFIYLCITDKISGKDMYALYSMIVVFYFGTQSAKKE